MLEEVWGATKESSPVTGGGGAQGLLSGRGVAKEGRMTPSGLAAGRAGVIAQDRMEC